MARMSPSTALRGLYDIPARRRASCRVTSFGPSRIFSAPRANCSIERVFESGSAPENHTNREVALATAVLWVGGMVLAKSVATPELGDEIRAAAMRFGLEIGGWEDLHDG